MAGPGTQDRRPYFWTPVSDEVAHAMVHTTRHIIRGTVPSERLTAYPKADEPLFDMDHDAESTHLWNEWFRTFSKTATKQVFDVTHDVEGFKTMWAISTYEFVLPRLKPMLEAKVKDPGDDDPGARGAALALLAHHDAAPDGTGHTGPDSVGAFFFGELRNMMDGIKRKEGRFRGKEDRARRTPWASGFRIAFDSMRAVLAREANAKRLAEREQEIQDMVRRRGALSLVDLTPLTITKVEDHYLANHQSAARRANATGYDGGVRPA